MAHPAGYKLLFILHTGLRQAELKYFGPEQKSAKLKIWRI